jgi:hypothetical protein
MKELNWPRLIWTGIIAGLILVAGETVLNGLLLGPEWEQVLFERNLQIGPGAGIAMLGITLMLGIFLAWLTVLLRQRTGSGVIAVLEAAVTVWFTVFLYTCAWLGILKVFPWRRMIFGIIWGLGETILAALAAGWFYNRGNGPARKGPKGTPAR